MEWPVDAGAAVRSTAAGANAAAAKECTTGRQLEGKVALVTGASRTVGRGVAIGLAELGATVFIVSRRLTPRKPARRDERQPLWGSLRETAKQARDVGGTAVPIVCDVSQDEQIARAFAEIDTSPGRLDILVNSAWG